MSEFKVTINGNDYNIVVNSVEENLINVEVNGQAFSVETEKPLKAAKSSIRPVIRSVESTVSAPSTTVSKPSAAVSKPSGAAPSSGGESVKSPLPGVILDVAVKTGDVVKTGQKLFVLEAMKMENVINSDKDGKIIEIKVQKGDSVLEGADLAIIG
jgi:biotin carboxyl carrier protein